MRFGNLLRRALIIFIATRIIVFGIAYGWLWLEPRHEIMDPREPIWHGDTGGHGAAAEPWRRWDALWFMKTAREGYSFIPGRQNNTSIMPLYPTLMSGLMRAGVDAVWSGVLISNAFLFISTMLMLYLGACIIGAHATQRATLALLLFPTSFVFSGAYSESLFLCATLGAFAFALRDEWAEAGLCGFAAALTRFTGVTLIVPLAVVFFLNKKKRGGSPARILWLLFIPLAPLVFFAYLDVSTGSFWNYFHAQAGWDKKLAWPWVGLAWEIVGRAPRLDNVLNVGAAAAFTALGVAVWRRYGAAFGLFMLLGVLAPACAAQWIGMPRYMAVLFPAFWFIGAALKNKYVFAIYLTASVSLMVIVFRAFANWHFSL